MLCKLIVFLVLIGFCLGCSRTPWRIPHGRKKTGDNGYKIIIKDVENGYVPGKIYNVFLLGSRTHNKVQQFSYFTLAALATNTTASRRRSRFTSGSPQRVGRFQLFPDSLAKFSEQCINTVSQVDDLAKTEIQAMWVAPSKGSGCVALAAMVYENRSSWFADDGELSKVICESRGTPAEADEECCACDEAKYNFIFEGLWTNETHPKDYPFAVWLTHFSDIIGATHDTNFSFWGENHIASDGFKSLAEWGSIRLMETELRAKGPRLRTLIKAAGLWYPNVNQNTSSHFKVDRKHPKLSLASMIGPSPDWVLGVSGLNLCLKNCTWQESLDIDLYLWDAGTDHGISYMSPNAETFPRERMHRITTMYPEDPRAPLYNPNADSYPPLARLYIRKERNIRRSCDDDFLQQVLDVAENSDDESTVAPECETSPYSDWSPCSVTCGKGLKMRTRAYVSQVAANKANCKRQLISKEMCVADVAECIDNVETDDEDENLAASSANVDDAGEGVGVCRTTKWSAWGDCSQTCGVGVSMRTRSFIDHMGRKKCPHISIVEKEKCMKPECSLNDLELPDPMCPTTPWSDWSPCTKTCGRGITIRTRLLLLPPEFHQKCIDRIQLNQQKVCQQSVDCNIDADTAKVYCAESIEAGPCRGRYERYAYDPASRHCVPFIYGGCRGTHNNFLTYDECATACNAT